MQAGTGTEIAIGLAACAVLLAIAALMQGHAARRERAGLAFAVAGLEVGAALLTAAGGGETQQSGRLDRALDGWDRAARRLGGRPPRTGLLEVMGQQVVDLWERAYPHVQHRRLQDPTRWSALADRYVDAYERQPTGDALPARTERSRTPDEDPLLDPEPVEATKPESVAAAPPSMPDPTPVVPALPDPEPVEARQPDPEPAKAESVDPWLAALRAGLAGLAGQDPSRPVPVRLPDVRVPDRLTTPVRPPQAAARHVVIDLVDVEIMQDQPAGFSD